VGAGDEVRAEVMRDQATSLAEWEPTARSGPPEAGDGGWSVTGKYQQIRVT